MNRRNFIIASSFGLALAGNRAAAQISSSSTALYSELTGGQVDISNTELNLVQQHVDSQDGSEHFHFTTPQGSKFDIYFWPVVSGTSHTFVDGTAGMMLSLLGGEVINYESYNDGGWIAVHSGTIKYFEYQMGAYPDHDLITLIWNDHDEFDYIFEQAQKIMVDGMPPMLFAEDSGILALSAEHSLSDPDSTQEAPAQSSESNSATDSSSSNVNSDAVARVVSHQRDFYASYESFVEYLETYGSDVSTKEQKDDAFFQLLNVSADWQNATVYAKDVDFSSQEAELESLYLDWAQLQRDLGFALEGVLLGSGDVDTYATAEAAFFKIDEELTALISTLG